MPKIDIRVDPGTKDKTVYQILKDGKVVLSTESQGEAEEELKRLRKRPKLADRDKVQEMLDDLQDHLSEQLTDWERGFVSDIQDQYEQTKELTPAQRAKLEEVLDRAAARVR